jgi:DNA-binding winged helix-turn-helix (wHTH) protein/tetratricopeptide (TPR) repeat protein
MNSVSHKVYDFGEFRLEPEKRLLSRQGRPVALTPKVFETLLHLVQHGNRVLDKEDLMQALWPDTAVEENNLNQNISVLRRVLGENRGEERYIATIPGRGYRFVAEVRLSQTNPASPQQTSIAVLPFKPLLAAHRDEALELGMTEALIAKLSRTRNTVVRPLSAVRRFAGLEQDPLAAGIALSVQSVLDGSIQREGNQVRVTVRLLNVVDGSSMWAQSFDREFTTVFELQETISQRVAAALSLQLNGEEQKALQARETENVEAYHLYLKGWYHLGKATLPTILKGIEFCQRAIDLDPVYALAYAGIAEGYRRLPITSDIPPREAFPKAKAAASKALEIDGNIAEAHVALGFCKLWFEWEWDAAEKEFRRAIDLNPGSGISRMGYAILLTALGRHDEALQEGQQAIELDPLSPILNANIGWALHCAKRDEQGLLRIQKTLEIEPNFWVALLHGGRIHLQMREYSKAIEAFTHARRTSAENSETISLLAYAHALAGEGTKALQLLEELQEQSQRKYIPPHNIAVIHQGLGNREQAFRWLDKAFEDRDVRLSYLKIDPKWDCYRSEPRFRELLRKIGF